MKKIIVIICISILIFSCNSSNKENYTVFSFIPEIFPYTDSIYANHLNAKPFFTLGEEKQSKLIFYINGDCSVCFARIVEWQNFINANSDLFNKKDIRYALVIYSEQLDILGYNLEKIPNTLPIYIDTAQYFSTYNNLPLTQPSITLLDSNNVVLYSSLTNKNKNKNYYKEIKKSVKKLE